MKPSVFISYSQKDLEFAKKLKEALEAQQIGVTIDLEAAKIGDHLQQFIETAVRENLMTVTVISRNSLQSVWVMAEALENWMYEKVEGQKRFLPIFIDRSLFDDDFFLEVAESLVNKITELAYKADKAVKMSVGTAHLDLDRKRVETLKNNLDTLFKTLRERLSADFTTDAKIQENLPKLIAEIRAQIARQLEPIRKNEPEEPLPADPMALRNAYLNRLLEDACRVSLAGIDRKAAGPTAETCLNLDEIYTALLTIGAEQTEEASSQRMEAERRPISALERLNRHARLVLLGDPGSGKSTFVNFVTTCLAGELLSLSPQGEGAKYANLALLTAPLPTEKDDEEAQRQPWEHGALLPVRIILRDFAARGLPPIGQPATATDLWRFIAAEFGKTPFGDYAPYLRQHLLNENGLLLLDGLDEVPEAKEQQRRTQIKQTIEDFARCFPKCRIMVTSRTYSYQKQDWRLQGFAEARLAPFTKGQIQQFIDRWYPYVGKLRGMSTENARGRAESLKRAILSSKRLLRFAEQPLLLTLMASLHAWRGGSLPEKREELYADAVELLLDWWESPKMVKDAHETIKIVQPSLTELLNVGKEPVQRALNELAFQAHQRTPTEEQDGIADITERDLKNKLLEISENPDLKPVRLVEYLS